MSAGNYEFCPGCEQKALYVGEDDVPGNIEVWHSEYAVQAEAAAVAKALETRRFPLAVRFSHPDAGYQIDQERAAELLTAGEVYWLAAVDIGRSHTGLRLQDVPGHEFNSVMFSPAWPDDEEWPGDEEEAGS